MIRAISIIAFFCWASSAWAFPKPVPQDTLEMTYRSSMQCSWVEADNDYTDCTPNDNSDGGSITFVEYTGKDGKDYASLNKLRFRITGTDDGQVSKSGESIYIVTGVEEASKKKIRVFFGPDYVNAEFPKAGLLEFIDVDYITDKDEAKNDEDSYVPGSELITGSAFGIGGNKLLTNHHVAGGLRNIQVFQNGKKLGTATVTASDPATDIALVTVSGFSPTGCRIDPENQHLGTDIFVYGYPQVQDQGLSLKVTKGIISSNFGYHDDAHEYQIDAAVQPGNSGGPVTTKDGTVVGMTVSLLEGSQNVNYAIKASYLASFLTSVGAKNTAWALPEDCTYMLMGNN